MVESVEERARRREPLEGIRPADLSSKDQHDQLLQSPRQLPALPASSPARRAPSQAVSPARRPGTCPSAPACRPAGGRPTARCAGWLTPSSTPPGGSGPGQARQCQSPRPPSPGRGSARTATAPAARPRPSGSPPPQAVRGVGRHDLVHDRVDLGLLLAVSSRS